MSLLSAKLVEKALLETRPLAELPKEPAFRRDPIDLGSEVAHLIAVRT
jgi:hypothetical protein